MSHLLDLFIKFCHLPNFSSKLTPHQSMEPVFLYFAANNKDWTPIIGVSNTLTTNKDGLATGQQPTNSQEDIRYADRLADMQHSSVLPTQTWTGHDT